MAIITLSRGMFSGGELLAEHLSKRLGYACIGREVIRCAAAEYGVPPEKLDDAIEKEINMKEYFALDIDRPRYLSFIQAALCAAVKKNDTIYYGHGGHVLLTGVSHVIKVKLISDPEQRIRFAMEHRKLSREEAQDYIRVMDQQRMKWTKFLYNTDWNSSRLYDIVINLKTTTISTACGMICALTQADEFRTTKASASAMENLALISRIKAVLASNDFTRYLTVEVQADNGFVTLSGRVHTMQHTRQIKEIVRNIEGVRGIHCTCHPYYFDLDKEDIATLAHLR